MEHGEQKHFIEVKGVTLEAEGAARFPDAPTERGIKHIRELMEAKKQGFLASIVFVIQMKGISYFEPNKENHPEFARALKEAKDAGWRSWPLTVKLQKIPLRGISRFLSWSSEFEV